MPGAFRILSPTGHLGFTPVERASFEAGMATRPDAVAADSGSNDIGPYPLGADVTHSPREWQYGDLDLLVDATRRARIPLVIGYCPAIVAQRNCPITFSGQHFRQAG